jgi:hypothetical protein
LISQFGTWENFRTKHTQFEVANFETAYNSFLGRPSLTKFMTIPHYVNLVLKMTNPNGVISIRGDVKRAYNCDRESREMADALLASVELQNLKKAMTESPPDPVMPESKRSKISI